MTSSTQGIVVSVYTSPKSSHPLALATAGVDLSAGSTGCTSTADARTCTFDIPAPAGTDDVVFTSYDAVPQANGTIAAAADALASASVTEAIVAGQTNPLAVDLHGIVASLVTPASLSFAVPNVHPQTLSFLAYDADRNVIDADGQPLAPGSSQKNVFANPITFTVDDPSGFTTLSKNGAAPTTSVTVDSNADVVQVAIENGAPSGNSATITESGIGLVASNDIPTTVLAGSFTSTLSTASLVADGPAATLTLAEPGLALAGSFFTTSITNAGTAACPANALDLSDFEAQSGQVVTIVGYAAAHCTLSFTDGFVAKIAKVTIAPATTIDPGTTFAAAAGNTVTSYDVANPPKSVSFVAAADAIYGIARDAAGDAYITTEPQTGQGPYALQKYAARSSGHPSPSAMVTANGTNGFGDVAVDGAGHVYVVSGPEIVEYSADLSTQIAVLAGTSTGLVSYGALAVDGPGHLYVGSPAGIAVFAPLAPGDDDTAPQRTLPFSSEDGPANIAVDASGDIFFDGPVTPNDSTFTVSEIATGSTSIATPFTTEQFPSGLAVVGNRLYVSQQSADIHNFPQYPEPTLNVVAFALGSAAATPIPIVDLQSPAQLSP